jgi:hypothetical protein
MLISGPWPWNIIGIAGGGPTIPGQLRARGEQLIIIGALLAVISSWRFYSFLYWQKQNTAGLCEPGSGVFTSHEKN